MTEATRTSSRARSASPSALRTTSRVVDFEAYRQARAQMSLPLAAADEREPAGADVTARSTAHRRRMLAHLGAMLSGCRS
jgi:hypothetical protein